MTRRARCVLPLLLLAACARATAPTPESDLRKLAKSLDVIASSIGVVQDTVIAANTQHFIDDAITGKVLQATTKASKLGKDAVALVRTINALTPEARAKLVNLITPLSQAITAISLDTVSNSETKAKIQALLASLATTVSSVQLILASGG